MNLDEVQSCTILRGVVGSTVHGLALPGTDDRDEMGVCVEPPEYVIGLQHFEQYVHRTAEERQPQKGGIAPPSQPGDLDLTIYSLRKWARLARQGNPSVLLLLFLPASHVVEQTAAGTELVNHARIFASKAAGARFLGYLESQKQRLLGERGQMRVTRSATIAAHGYDTKYAMHMLRLGYQGVEYLNTGRISLPMPEMQRERCMAIRRGEVPMNDVLTETGLLEEELRDLRISSVLPDEPYDEGIDELLIRLYESAWGAV